MWNTHRYWCLASILYHVTNKRKYSVTTVVPIRNIFHEKSNFDFRFSSQFLPNFPTFLTFPWKILISYMSIISLNFSLNSRLIKYERNKNVFRQVRVVIVIFKRMIAVVSCQFANRIRGIDLSFNYYAWIWSVWLEHLCDLYGS